MFPVQSMGLELASSLEQHHLLWMCSPVCCSKKSLLPTLEGWSAVKWRTGTWWSCWFGLGNPTTHHMDLLFCHLQDGLLTDSATVSANIAGSTKTAPKSSYQTASILACFWKVGEERKGSVLMVVRKERKKGVRTGPRSSSWRISLHAKGATTNPKTFPPFAKIHGKLPATKSLSSVTPKGCPILDHREQRKVCLCLLWRAGNSFQKIFTHL